MWYFYLTFWALVMMRFCFSHQEDWSRSHGTTHLDVSDNTQHHWWTYSLLPQPCHQHCRHHTHNWTQPPKFTLLQAWQDRWPSLPLVPYTTWHPRIPNALSSPHSHRMTLLHSLSSLHLHRPTITDLLGGSQYPGLAFQVLKHTRTFLQRTGQLNRIWSTHSSATCTFGPLQAVTPQPARPKQILKRLSLTLESMASICFGEHVDLCWLWWFVLILSLTRLSVEVQDTLTLLNIMLSQDLLILILHIKATRWDPSLFVGDAKHNWFIC